MFRSAGCRGSLGVCLVALSVTVLSPFAPPVDAEAFEPLARTFRRQLGRHSPRKVLIVFREDDRDPTGKAAPEELQALRRQLVEVCRELKVADVRPEAGADAPTTTLSEAVDPSEWHKTLKTSRADAVVNVTWKGSKSGFAVRVSLLDDKKLHWNGRATLRRRPAAGTQIAGGKAAAGKQPGIGAKSNGAGGTALHIPSIPGNQALMLGLLTMNQGNGTGVGTAAGAAIAGATGGGVSPTPTPTTELNAKILEFASANLGKQVGNGQCYTLALEALAYAGAAPPRGNDWGDEVPTSELLPGDILQFYNASLVSPVAGTWQLGDPGHTAIVGEVQGLLVTVYHQNINGQLSVRKDLLDLGSLVGGQIIPYRALSR